MKNIMSFFRRSELAASLAPYKREFLAVGFFSMVANLLALTPSLYMLQVFDRVMVSKNDLTLIALSLITLFLFAMMSFAEWARSRLLVRLGVRMDDALGSRVFGATFEARLNRADPAVARSFYDLANFRQFLTSNGVIAFFDVPWTPIYLAVQFLLHPLLGWISVLGIVILAFMAWLTQRYTARPIEQARDAGIQVNQDMQSKLRNAEVVESMGMRADLWRRWLKRHQHHLHLTTKAHDLGHRIRDLTKFLRYSLQSIILGAGALLVIDGQLTPWVIVIGNLLLGRTLAPVELAIGNWRGFTSARTSFLRLETLLAAHPGRADGLFHGEPAGEIQLENLIATARGRTEPILRGLTLTVPAGEVIGIIGPSGSGKSTLARVILGIWPDIEGDVRLDGEPLASWSREELGPYIGYMPQDVQLFDGTIAENIARFGPIESEKVIRAAQLAGVHDMVLRFPRGYDTMAGVGGSYLSGGQRQRIALARAIYADPNLIVLDEPNSNLDEAGEAALTAAIKHLKANGKTVVLISHRLNILAIADRILVLRQGAVEWYGLRQDFANAFRAPVPPQQSAA
jgi:ATP-binding cassette subfamily C exporter for protease/lipase